MPERQNDKTSKAQHLVRGEYEENGNFQERFNNSLFYVHLGGATPPVSLRLHPWSAPPRHLSLKSFAKDQQMISPGSKRGRKQREPTVYR